MDSRKSLVILIAVTAAAALAAPLAASAIDKVPSTQGGGDNLYQGRGTIDLGNRHNNRRGWEQRRVNSWINRPEIIDGKRRRRSDFSGDGPLPDFIRNLGTFSGSISAVRDRRNGIYFYRNRNNTSGMKILTAPSPTGPKIIGVTPESFEAACDRQGSVCVIKPR